MGRDNKDDLEGRMLGDTPDSTPPDRKKTIDGLADTSKEPKKIRDLFVSVGKYLTDRQRLKAAAVLGGTIAGVAVLKDQLPEITQYFRESFPSLSQEAVSLTVDTVTNTLMAPLGFLLSNYAHGRKLNKKEFMGQVAFAFGWGVLRHYVYSGLSNFDEPVNIQNASLKTGLYTLYYAFYGGFYAAFSEYWSKVCSGVSHLGAIKGVSENFKKKLKALAKDSEIQFNLALNIANMFNPWVESRPTVAGGLLVQYNMSVVRHSHEREYGLLGYLKSIFMGNKDNGEKSAPS